MNTFRRHGLQASLALAAAALAGHAGAANVDSKQMVTAAYEALFAQGRMDVAEQYFRTDYIQHNPRVPTGRAGLIGYLKAFREQFPQQNIQILRVIGDGDMVAVHAMWEVSNPQKQMKMFIVDIFRVQEQKIAEHWDVIQVLSLQ
jgi:predicted SnoaL-like aldol condensation-catalyzing enzyme